MWQAYMSAVKQCMPDAVRKQEHCKLSQAGRSPLKGSKWAWCIKENFSQFWSYSYKGAAKHIFKAWSNNAMRSKLKPVKKVVKMFRRHEEGLQTTASTESATPMQRVLTAPSNSSRPMPVVS